MSKRYSNLLAQRFRNYLLVRRRLMQWSIIWSVCLFTSLLGWRVQSQGVVGLAERVALQEARCTPLHQMSEENTKFRKQLQDMNSHESLLVRLDDEQVPYRLLALVSTQVSERGGDVRIESFQMSRAEADPRESRQPNTKTEEKANDTPVKLSLKGFAADNLAVSLFVAGLRDCGVFESVELKSSMGARRDSEHAHSFIIECAL